MTADAYLVSAQDLIVEADYGQIYIWAHDPDDEQDDPDDEQEDDDEDDYPWIPALDDAHNSGRSVGVLPGFIDLLTASQWNFHTPMRVEIWSGEPADDRSDWDHEVDADLAIPDGRLFFEASGGGIPRLTTVPAGAYRVRISGRGYAQASRHIGGGDSYRLRLWPDDRTRAPVLRKRWSGSDPDYKSTPPPDSAPEETPDETAQQDTPR